MSIQTTLDQAYDSLVDKRCGGIYIFDKNPNEIMGFITFEQIRLYLVKGKLV
jgi:CIC family chloride channel protein